MAENTKTEQQTETEESRGAQQTDAQAEQGEERPDNAAMRARGASGDEVKKLTDTPQVQGGETWDTATGHSGRPTAWAATGVMMAAFACAGASLLWHVWVLLWIGVGVFLVVGAVGLGTGVWSDYDTDH